jgi:ureidoglycolate lyase
MTHPETLTIQPLTTTAFAAFGDVIEAVDAPTFSINDGQAQRFHDLATVDVGANGGRPLISIVRSAPTCFPITLHKVERHPLGSQAFIPLGEHPFLVIVAPTTADDLPGELHAFLSNGRQGVNYRPGVWHHPLVSLNQTTDFLVIDRGGAGENCDVVDLNGKIRITTPVVNFIEIR